MRLQTLRAGRQGRPAGGRRLGPAAVALGLAAPAALAIVAGRVSAGDGPDTFNLPVAVAAGAVCVGVGTAMLRPGRRRPPAPPSPHERKPTGRSGPDGPHHDGPPHDGPDPDISWPDLDGSVPTEPVTGSRVRVRTHFTEAGGYVAFGPLLYWASAARGRAEDYTPGTPCVVTRVDGEVLAIATDAGGEVPR